MFTVQPFRAHVLLRVCAAFVLEIEIFLFSSAIIIFLKSSINMITCNMSTSLLCIFIPGAPFSE